MARKAPWSALLALLLVVFACLFSSADAVDHNKFKTCAQSGFCSRNRAYAEHAGKTGFDKWKAPYALDAASASLKDGTLTGTVHKTLFNGETRALPLTLSFLASGVARVTLDEDVRRTKNIELRHGSSVRKERCDEAGRWALVGGLAVDPQATLDASPDAGTLAVNYGPGGSYRAVVTLAPFGVVFQRDGETHVSLNHLGLMNVEHWRPHEEPKEGESLPDEQATWWDETFGGATDSKPRGPESVALDFGFHGYADVYGVPEHSGPMSLRETKGGGNGNFDEPYRLYNSDVFEYEIDSPMTLYGSIPLMQAQRKNSTVGVFWLNSAETWIDIKKDTSSSNPKHLSGSGPRTDTYTHWMSESGLLDAFVFLGPSPAALSSAYAELTGHTQLPAQFALGYHQCRWNYVTDEDVRDVDRKMDRHAIPYDVIWLDIDYLDDKKFFTWDPLTFADPLGMETQLDEHGRKLVVIIDPHVKKLEGYHVHDELTAKNLAVQNKERTIYEGWCWPGASYWMDGFAPALREWVQSLYTYAKFAGTMGNVFIWNDMNEPSVFNGPEMTMQKDNIHAPGWEHRDIHNANGQTFVNATFHALATRDDPKGRTPTSRPFVLTRSFFAGSQRLGAMWTGDNMAQWSHLAGSLPMVLAQGISGFPFAGADVGGFMGNPSQELLARWYQAGAFYPFFRGHSHIDTKRREPYLSPEPERGIIASALRLRYSLLPSWYTAFHEASTTGYPIVRPMWWAHPSDAAGFSLDDQMYLGSTGLLVKPVTAEGATSVNVHLPVSERADGSKVPYYDYDDYTTYLSGDARSPARHTISAPLDKIPLLMRAGHVFARRDRPRRSAALMQNDPFTLVVVLDPAALGAEDADGNVGAQGTLYHDDGSSYAYTRGSRIHRQFTFAGTSLTSSNIDIDGAHPHPVPQTPAFPLSALLTKPDKAFAKGKAAYLSATDALRVEKIVIVGAPKSWKGKSVVSVVDEEGADGKVGKGSREVDVSFVEGAKGKADSAVVRDPKVRIGRGWRIVF